MVDQDQSDNVITSYLINGNGQTAQNTTANAAAIAGATVLVNGSDDKLLAAFLDPANGCTPFTAPDASATGGTSGSQALNELSARVNQQGPIAVTPPNDEMTLVNSAFSVAKTNVYRSLVDQPLLAGNVNATQVAMDYCQNITNIQPARNQLDITRELNFGTPVAAVGNNLATFMGNRLSMSFVNLGCANFGLANPVTRHARRQPGGHRGYLQHRSADREGVGGGDTDRQRYGRHRRSRRRHRRPADQAAPGGTRVRQPVPYVARRLVLPCAPAHSMAKVAPRKLGAAFAVVAIAEGKPLPSPGTVSAIGCGAGPDRALAYHGAISVHARWPSDLRRKDLARNYRGFGAA